MNDLLAKVIIGHIFGDRALKRLRECVIIISEKKECLSEAYMGNPGS